MSDTGIYNAQANAATGLDLEAKNISYQQYYQRVIDQQLKAENFNGLKLVVGPTGMGKTSAIPSVIAHLRAKQVDKRCIYTTHRHLLIKEMEQALGYANIPFVYLKNNVEVVETFLDWQDKGMFLNRLDEYDFFKLAGSSRTLVEKHIEGLRKEHANLEQLQRSGLHHIYTQQQEVFAERCNQFLGIFKSGLSSKELLEETHRRLVHDEIGIWILFPYVEFLYSPAQPVLLVTMQKLLYGFYNGCANERLLSLENNIIFLDEFDMQEKEMLTVLCRSAEIQNSFEFVRLFYEEMTRQQQLGHLEPGANDTERHKKAKQLALTIINKLKEDCKKEGFSFPEIRHFILREGEFSSNHLSVFQSGVQIMTNPFYLRERERVWEVVRQAGNDTLRARTLMRIIARTASAILDFFSELWADELLPEWQSWIEQCYDQKNDNVPGQYKKIINDYGFYRRPSRLATERHDTDIADSIYYQGYNFFRLVRGAYFTTPDEIRIEQKKLTVTPEYLLWRLSNANFLFALSATGDIKRYIHSFDMNWLEHNGRYLPIEDEDKALVANLKRNKETKRAYTVKLDIANELPKSHTLSCALSQLEQELFFNKENEEANETAIYHRKQALSLFLETVRWITDKSDNQAHLVFLNSFAFIEKFFISGNGLPPSFYTSHQIVINEAINSRSREYMLEIEGQQCQIIFLDAAKGREMGDQSFHQIQLDVPLVVITTYPTASNGVNLKWYKPDDDQEIFKGRDLESIHLLEAPHFYFSGSDDDDGIDKTKLFIWQIWKLYHNFQISESEFITALREINISEINTQYKATPDYLLNQIAVFHQALGRVDRQWESVPPIEVRLSGNSSGTLPIFVRYLTAPGIVAENRIEREAYTSSLILALYKEIEKQYLRQTIVNQLQYESIAQMEQRSRELTGRLLKIVSEMRKGAFSPADSQKIMGLWHSVREAALKQDYHFRANVTVTHLPTNQKQQIEVDFRRDFVSETAFMQDGEILFIDWEAQKIYRQPTQATKLYNLNRYYRQYARNSTLEWYFHTHNYRLCYEPANQNLFFTPYMLQNIVAGAVGEAALKAALQHFRIPLIYERDCPPPLFEIADMQLQGLPIYLDAKNYSQWTTRRFNVSVDDPAYDEKLNAESFLTAAQRKWKHIVAQTNNQNTKLVFINMAAGENHPNEGWNERLEPIQPYRFADSVITVIQGVIDTENPQEWRPDFVSWVNDVREIYHKLQGADDDNKK